MNKLIYILFVTIFLSLSIGVTINKHYSKGQLFSTALFGEAKSCCEGSCGCCDNDSETYQFLAQYLISEHQVDHQLIPIDFENSYAFLLYEAEEALIENSFNNFCVNRAPPFPTSLIFHKQSFLL